MRLRQTAAFLIFASFILFGVLNNYAAEADGGSWTLRKSSEPGKVEFSLIQHHHGGTSSHESDWSTGVFVGVGMDLRGDGWGWCAGSATPANLGLPREPRVGFRVFVRLPRPLVVARFGV